MEEESEEEEDNGDETQDAGKNSDLPPMRPMTFIDNKKRKIEDEAICGAFGHTKDLTQKSCKFLYK